MKTKLYSLITILIIALSAFSQFSFAQTPVNDLCTGATLMIPAASCSFIPGSSIYATQSRPQDPCAGDVLFTVKDVWYKFISNGAFAISIKVKQTSIPMAVTLYSNSCDNLTYIACANSVGNGVAQISV